MAIASLALIRIIEPQQSLVGCSNLLLLALRVGWKARQCTIESAPLRALKKSEIARISCFANVPISGTVCIVLEAALPPLPSWVCFFGVGIEQ